MNRRETAALLNQFGITPTRSLGQNFLVDERAVFSIIEAAELSANDLAIEIGPGAGTLTRLAVEQAGRIIAVEIDEKLRPLLETTLACHDSLDLIWADARQTRLDELAGDWTGSTVVFANLPYYITTELIEQLLCQLPQSRRMLLMVQKEAADRFLSADGTRHYGPLSILMDLHGPVTRLIELPPGAFWPRPPVASTVLMLDRRLDAPVWSTQTASRERFFKFLLNCFRQRRKQLKNNLAYLGRDPIKALFETVGLEQNVRAEQVTPAQYYQLFETLTHQSAKTNE